MSHSSVKVKATEWVEILWIGSCMPIRSRKSALCEFLKSLVEKGRTRCGLSMADPLWFLDDQNFEKNGILDVRRQQQAHWAI